VPSPKNDTAITTNENARPDKSAHTRSFEHSFTKNPQKADPANIAMIENTDEYLKGISKASSSDVKTRSIANPTACPPSAQSKDTI
jgi:hypothetical protein